MIIHTLLQATSPVCLEYTETVFNLHKLLEVGIYWDLVSVRVYTPYKITPYIVLYKLILIFANLSLFQGQRIFFHK